MHFLDRLAAAISERDSAASGIEMTALARVQMIAEIENQGLFCGSPARPSPETVFGLPVKVVNDLPPPGWRLVTESPVFLRR